MGKSKRNEAKSEKELNALKIAIKLGTSSRQFDTHNILNMINECNIVTSDVPDIIAINNAERKVFTIEHFRVDHHIKEQHGKIGASSIKFYENNEKIREKYVDIIEDNYENASNEIFNSLGKELERKFNATYGDFLKSFKYSIDNHRGKVEKYKGNNNIPKDFDIENVFFIEVVTDFYNIYLCDYRRCDLNKNGLITMTEEMVEILETVKSAGVNYIILLFHNYYNQEYNVMALDVHDLYKSIEKNGLKLYTYCGCDQYMDFEDKKRVNITFDEAGLERDMIKANSKIKYYEANDLYFYPAVCTATKKAMDCKNFRKPYIVDRNVLFMLEVFADHISGWKNIDDARLVAVNVKPMSDIIRKRRIRNFDLKYPYGK